MIFVPPMIVMKLASPTPARHHVHVQVFGQRAARRPAQVQPDVEARRAATRS